MCEPCRVGGDTRGMHDSLCNSHGIIQRKSSLVTWRVFDMNREIDFYQIYEYSVEVHHDEFGSVGRARLTFGNGKWPYLKFERSFETRRLVEGQKYHRLKAVSDTGEVFTLFECEYTLFFIQAAFLAEGDVEEKFKKICIRYADVSEWFMLGQGIHGHLAETLTWVNKPEPIEVIVKT